MKKIVIFLMSCSLMGCLNSSTSFSNRSVTYQVTPEMIGEHSAVSGSPTTADATVNAEKKYETSTKANVAQNLADNSSNDQSKNKDKEAEKSQPVEEDPAKK